MIQLHDCALSISEELLKSISKKGDCRFMLWSITFIMVYFPGLSNWWHPTCKFFEGCEMFLIKSSISTEHWPQARLERSSENWDKTEGRSKIFPKMTSKTIQSSSTKTDTSYWRSDHTCESFVWWRLLTQIFSFPRIWNKNSICLRCCRSDIGDCPNKNVRLGFLGLNAHDFN